METSLSVVTRDTRHLGQPVNPCSMRGVIGVNSSRNAVWCLHTNRCILNMATEKFTTHPATFNLLNPCLRERNSGHEPSGPSAFFVRMPATVACPRSEDSCYLLSTPNEILQMITNEVSYNGLLGLALSCRHMYVMTRYRLRAASMLARELNDFPACGQMELWDRIVKIAREPDSILATQFVYQEFSQER